MMASAWGLSWGTSWGVSWGANPVPDETVGMPEAVYYKRIVKDKFAQADKRNREDRDVLAIMQMLVKSGYL